MKKIIGRRSVGRRSVCILLVFICTSCQQQPMPILEKYFKVANDVIKGDTTEVAYLHTHLSKNATKIIKAVPLLMQYSLLSLTKNGTLEKSSLQKELVINKDSVVLTMLLSYKDGSSQSIRQTMVYEKNQWKLGISPQHTAK